MEDGLRQPEMSSIANWLYGLPEPETQRGFNDSEAVTIGDDLSSPQNLTQTKSKRRHTEQGLPDSARLYRRAVNSPGGREFYLITDFNVAEEPGLNSRLLFTGRLFDQWRLLLRRRVRDGQNLNIQVQVLRSLAGRGEVDLVLTVDGKVANTVRINTK